MYLEPTSSVKGLNVPTSPLVGDHGNVRGSKKPKFALKVRKNGQQKRTTCLATLLQNKLNSDVARFTTHIKPVLRQIRLLTSLNVGGKIRNIACQLVPQQYCKTSCTFFVARFYAP